MTAGPLPPLTLILGGARSGKSRHAEHLLHHAAPPLVYVATAEAHDDEMHERIAHHQARRGEHWRTLEVPIDLPKAIAGIDSGTVLIDCLTLWLSNILLAERDIDSEVSHLISALEGASVPIVAVSNEVGFGIVPETRLGRLFRDAQGILNQRVATIADRVILVTAGIPMTLK